MRTNRLQNIDSTRLTAEVRRSIHAQLCNLGHGPREVSRRNGVSEREAFNIALEVEREQAAELRRKAVRAERLRLLGHPTIH